MKYKPNNGNVLVLYHGNWWLAELLYECYPTLKQLKLIPWNG